MDEAPAPRHLRLGLRGKSLLALGLVCLVALAAAALIGQRLIDAIRDHFGQAYTRNLTLLNRERILAPISRELALSLRLADSDAVRAWLHDEDDADKRARMLREAESFRATFRDQAYFVISRASGHYYFNDKHTAFSAEPRYTLRENDPDDSWFYASMRETAVYNLNVNRDTKLDVTRIWINAVIRDGEAKLGLAGASLDLSGFLREFILSGSPGVTPLVFDDDGAIQAHPDPARIALNSVGREASAAQSVFALIDADAHAALREAMAASRADPEHAVLVAVNAGLRPQWLALSYLPELHWHVASLVDPRTTEILDVDWLTRMTAAAGVVLLLLLAGFGYSVERLVLRPLRALQRSADAMAAGEYNVSLPPQRFDEIGQLTQAFAVMAERVRRHTGELEGKVQERTAALEAANEKMRAAHKQIDDSIRYASLIQRATLPERDLQEVLDQRHFVWWRPRDVVGGDFYIFHRDGDNFLLGVMDCAGHGVPGALMTMLARSAIDQAIAQLGPRDPAALLTLADASFRHLLAEAQFSRAIATNTDAALIYVDRGAGQLRFAGAAIGLFCATAAGVERVQGSRRALGHRRGPDYRNHVLELREGMTYCLVTDGLLDQAGGEHGFGFGVERLCRLLQAHAHEPLAALAQALQATLSAYQGDHPQRDDITVLSFRL